MFQQIESLFGAAESLVTAGGIIVGGIWVYRRFRREEEDHPFIETSCDLKVIGQQGNGYIVEVVATLQNKGKVTHTFSSFTFELEGIAHQTVIEASATFRGQAHFPIPVASGSFKPDGTKEFFLPPQVTGKYSYVALVPAKLSFLMLHCTFAYTYDPSRFHSMECTIALPPSPTPASR